MKLFLYQKVCRALLVGLIGFSLNTQAGLLSVDAKDAANDIKNAGKAIVEDASEALQCNLKTLEVLVKDTSNSLLLTPVYGIGTAFIAASIYMYQKALNDYFDTIDTKEEALQTLSKKIKWKTIAGSAFLALGITTFYKSEAIAQLCLGYKPA